MRESAQSMIKLPSPWIYCRNPAVIILVRGPWMTSPQLWSIHEEIAYRPDSGAARFRHSFLHLSSDY